MRRPEVLAPAGSRETIRAAIRAGADAVYFGLHGLNARARAANFGIEDLEEVLAELHAHGARGYVALNTLVFDHELGEVERAIRACARAGVDALIVQDLGVARLARAIAPGLPLHASTQMTCTDAGSVLLAKELGASRVILARELSLDDVRDIHKNTDGIELEVFVHGALCVAYSGQCLTSEAIGGRSANRGACAQACRLPYELVVDGALRDLGDVAHLLSPEDLEASAIVPELMAIGVASLKIEGRLKGPDYVAATTRLYRAAIEHAIERAASERAGIEPASESSRALDALRTDALAAYSRGSGPGFLRGVDHQRLVDGRNCDHRGLYAGSCAGVTSERGRDWVRLAPEIEIHKGDGLLIEGGTRAPEVGGRVWEVEGDRVWLGPDVDVRRARLGARVFKTSDPIRERATLARLEREPHRVAIDVRLEGDIGAQPTLSAVGERGVRARVTCDAALAVATKHPLDEARVREQLGRLGESAFVLRGLELAIPKDAILPVSSLNRARRALVRELAEALARASRVAYETTDARAEDVVAGSLGPPPAPGLFVLCRTLEQAEAAVAAGASGVVLDFLELVGTGNAVRSLRASSPGVHVALAPPRIRKPGEEKIDKFLSSLEPDALLVRGLGALREGGGQGPARIADFSLNVTNRITAREVLSRGVCAFTPAFDLDAKQLLALLDDRELAERAEVVVHQPMPLFHMEHCVIAALLSEGRDHKTCGRPCERHRVSLRDRAGMEHPVEADVGCRNTVFHARAQSAAGSMPKLRARGVSRFRIELVRESGEDVERLVRLYGALARGERAAAEVLAELRAEDGYGVVSGSLRVVA